MITLLLQHQSLKQVDYRAEIPENTEIKLESKYKFNVDYSDDNKHCVATIEHVTKDTESADRFSIIIRLIGYFECDGINSDTDKKEAHLQAYLQLFPYVQSFIVNLTTASALPPLYISRDILESHLDDVSINVKNT